MKDLNTFQRALLDAGTKQFSDVLTESDIPISPSDDFRANFEKIGQQRSHRRALRLGLIAAAVTILLTGTIFAAVRFSLGGQIERSIYAIPEYNVENQKYDLSFREITPAPDAPDEIKEFLIPTVFVRKENILLTRCFLEGEGNVWYPHVKNQGTVEYLHGKIRDYHIEWEYGDSMIGFSQRTLVSVEPGKPVISFHFDASAPVKVEYETFTLGEYEIFCFRADYSKYIETEDPTNLIYSDWFWTDGYYLYQLTLPGELTEEEQMALFTSLAPVADIYDYLSIPE